MLKIFNGNVAIDTDKIKSVYIRAFVDYYSVRIDGLEIARFKCRDYEDEKALGDAQKYFQKLVDELNADT